MGLTVLLSALIVALTKVSGLLGHIRLNVSDNSPQGCGMELYKGKNSPERSPIFKYTSTQDHSHCKASQYKFDQIVSEAPGSPQ